MICVILALAVAPTANNQCLSAHEAEVAGLRSEMLEVRYSPALRVWPDDEAAVSEAWKGFTQPLRRLDGTVSLTAYFAANGSVDAVVVNGSEERAHEVCAALGALDSYTWPLTASKPFRQCGSIVSASNAASDFQLTVQAPTEEVCVGAPIPVTVAFENVGPSSRRVWMPKDGTLKNDINISLVTDSASEPLQLIDPTITGPFVVAPMSIEPGGKVSGTVNLASYLLPTSQPLGQTPGTYRLYADVLKQGDETTWSGIVWSKPFEVEVRACD